MLHFEANTKLIHETGIELRRIANEITSLNEYILKKITEIGNTNSAWIGDSADRFTAKIEEDFKQYNTLADILNAYGDNLMNAAEKIERSIRYLQ